MSIRHLLTIFFILVIVLSACSTSEPSDTDVGVDDEDATTFDADSEVDADDPVVELRLHDVTPDEGELDGGTEVTLGGQGFQEGMTVYFGDNEAPQVTRMGGLSAQAISPPGDTEGTVDVTVANRDGGEATVVDGFRYFEDDDVENNDENGEEPEAPSPQACGVQFPIIAEALSLTESVEITLYGRVYEPGITDQPELPDDLVAQALIAPYGNSPADDIDQYIVIDAERNPEYTEDDFEEFEATIAIDSEASPDEAISHAETWIYAFRFSLDGGDHWTVCDIAGLVDEDEPDLARFATLEVFDTAQDRVHFCGTWPQELTGAVGESGPTIDMELYEEGITDDADGFDDSLLEVEAGFGPVGTNPALAYEWTPMDYQGQVEGNENNAHYAGPLYETGDAPDAGDYEALTRARIQGQEAWRYCNTDDEQSDFLRDLITAVTVNDDD